MKDYYYLLGLNRNASDDDIRKAYRKLSKKFHPDVNDGDLYFTERFKDIQEAYEVLSDFKRKSEYDLKSKLSNNSEYEKYNIPDPKIIHFNSDSNCIEIGGKITFDWKTVDADIVSIEPFGQVIASGRITYKINNLKSERFTFTLKAKNSSSNKTTESNLTVSVKPIPELKNNRENTTVSSESKYNSKTNENNKEILKKPSIDLFLCNNSDSSHTPFAFYEDEIIVEWKTSNAQKVFLDPVGFVAKSGTTKVKISKGLNNPFILKINVFNDFGIETDSRESSFVISEVFSNTEGPFKVKDDREFNYIFAVCSIIFIPILIFLFLILFK